MFEIYCSDTFQSFHSTARTTYTHTQLRCQLDELAHARASAKPQPHHNSSSAEHTAPQMYAIVAPMWKI